MPISINGTTGVVFQDGSTQATSAFTGFRNKFINGGMTVNQRNSDTAVTGDGGYPLDRFQQSPYGTGTGQRFAFTNPSPIPGLTHYLQFARTASGNNYSIIGQKVENVKVISGQQMTFSFWVRGDVINASGWSAWGAAYKDDTTFIAYSPNNGTTFTVTGTWTRVTMRMDVPTISVDPGANGGHFYIFLRCTGANENFNIQTTGWQWELGTTATPFEVRPYGTELALCQRYYEIGYAGGIGCKATGNNGIWDGYGQTEAISWKVTKRIDSATFTTWNFMGKLSNNTGSYTAPLGNYGGPSPQNINRHSVELGGNWGWYNNAGSNVSNIIACKFNWACEAEL